MEKRKTDTKKNHKSVEVNENIDSTYREYEDRFFQVYDRLIESANKEFGIDCWSHSVVRDEIDCADISEGIYNVGVCALVRLEKKNGIYHEGLGYGLCNEYKSKPLSICIARKEAFLKGLSLALQCFYDVRAVLDLDISAKKGYGSGSQVPRLIVPSSGLDEVDSMPVDQLASNAEKKRDFSSINQNNSNNILWKKAKLPIEPTPQNAGLISPKPLSKKSANINSCNTPSHSAAASLSDSGEDEEKLERIRKQRQKQEEFRLRFKQNPSEKVPRQRNQGFQNQKSNERGKMDELIETMDAAEASFISTQELNEMIQTTTVHSASTGPLHRVPLLSSPSRDTPMVNW